MERKTFELTCRAGEVHSYSCLPHYSRTGGGLDLLLEIASVSGPVLGGLIKSLLGFAEEDAEGIDLSILTDSVAAIPERLITHGGSAFIGKMLKNTRRDGKELAKPHEFDAAYTGNYGEMIKAVGKVLEINFSPFGTDGMSSLKEILQNAMHSAEALMSKIDPEAQTKTAGQ